MKTMKRLLPALLIFINIVVIGAAPAMAQEETILCEANGLPYVAHLYHLCPSASMGENPSNWYPRTREWGNQPPPVGPRVIWYGALPNTQNVLEYTYYGGKGYAIMPDGSHVEVPPPVNGYRAGGGPVVDNSGWPQPHPPRVNYGGRWGNAGYGHYYGGGYGSGGGTRGFGGPPPPIQYCWYNPC